MKKTILLLMLAITGNAVIAQTNKPCKIFVIDPVGSDSFDNSIKFGGLFKFKILHVNDIKLNGYISSKPFTFVTSAPATFTSVGSGAAHGDSLAAKPENLLQKLSASQNGLLTTNYELMATQPISKRGKSLKKAKLSLIEKAMAVQQSQIDLLKDALSVSNLQTEFADSYHTFIDAYQKLQLYTGVEDTIFKMLPDVIVADPKTLVKNVKDYMSGVYDTADTTHYRGKVKSALADINTSFINLKTAYQALNKVAETDTVILDGQLKDKDGSLVISISKVQGKISLKPKFEEEYKSAVKIFTSLNAANNQAVLYNKGVKGITLYQIIMNDKFIIYTDAQQMVDDEVTVTPALKNNAGTVVKQFNPVTIKAFGGLKVNFSTGYLLTFKGDDNYAYYYGGTPNTINGIVKQKTNALTNSLGALAHVYLRTANGASAGLAGGFSLTNNGNVGFYLGGSGLFLEKNRLALTAGISFVKISTLNTGNLTSVDGVNKYTFNSTDTKINYDSLYRPGFFIGITYNIFGSSSTTSSSSTSNNSNTASKSK